VGWILLILLIICFIAIFGLTFKSNKKLDLYEDSDKMIVETKKFLHIFMILSGIGTIIVFIMIALSFFTSINME